LLLGRLHLDLTAHRPDAVLYDRQPQADAAHVNHRPIVRVRAGEPFEYRSESGLGDADTIVSNVNANPAVVCYGGYFDVALLLIRI
jgi:hypothetical protein